MSTLKDTMLFSFNFLRHPSRNASLVPSSGFTSRAMLRGIDFSAVTSVVELGPGLGVFTEEVLRRCRSDTKVLLVEIEGSYVRILEKKFGSRVHIERESAHRLDTVLEKHHIERPDVIISGLPFSLDTAVTKKLFKSVRAHTERGTIFRFFTYNPPMMKRVYKDLPIRKVSFVFRNVPPLWVYGIN